MSISELIRQVGDDNVQVQWLQSCMKRADSKKGHCEIAFATEALSPNDLMALVTDSKRQPRNTGLILWITTDKLPESLRSRLYPKEVA